MEYLREQIEKAHSAYINRLVCVALSDIESERDHNEIIIDFKENHDTKKICEILNWKQDQDTVTLIEERLKNESLAFIMYQSGRAGFLAEVHFPKYCNFKLDEQTGEIRSNSIVMGHALIEWVYGINVDELVLNTQKKSEEVYQYWIEQHQKELIKESSNP